MITRRDIRQFGYGVGVLALAVLAYAQYKRLDSMGWIPHRENVDLSMDILDKWDVGESKDCMSYPLTDELAKITNRSMEVSAIKPLDCNRPGLIIETDLGQQLPNVPITFWGRTEQSAYEWVVWRCTRNSDSFICKQIGNSRPTLRGADRSTGRRVKSYDGGSSWQWADL